MRIELNEQQMQQLVEGLIGDRLAIVSYLTRQQVELAEVKKQLEKVRKEENVENKES